MKKGRVIINRNICDNAPECNGIAVCPTGALYWDSKDETIEYKADECIDCGLCADTDGEGCPVGALLWGKDDEEYNKNKEYVDSETRKLEDLEVERYGAAPMEDYISELDIETYIEKSDKKYVLLELFNDDSIHCLLHSIRVEDIKELFYEKVDYTKVELSNETSKCKQSDLPSLLIYKDKELICTIKGYFDDSDEKQNEFFTKIKKAL